MGAGVALALLLLLIGFLLTPTGIKRPKAPEIKKKEEDAANDSMDKGVDAYDLSKQPAGADDLRALQVDEEEKFDDDLGDEAYGVYGDQPMIEEVGGELNDKPDK